MPVDALKTTLQVEGAQGLKVLGSKIAAGGPFVLWHGALAASTATYADLALARLSHAPCRDTLVIGCLFQDCVSGLREYWHQEFACRYMESMDALLLKRCRAGLWGITLGL